MTALDPVDVLLGAMFAAWREDIDAEPVPDIVAAVLRGEHTTARQLSHR